MATFDITIQRRFGTAWPVVVEPSSALKSRIEGELQLDDKVLAALRASTTPQAHGKLLGQALFRDDVDRAFGAALLQARSDPDPDQRRLHVLLFVEAEDLPVDAHWERLCAPWDGAWHPLAFDQQVVFSFFVPSPVYGKFQPIGSGDLRALVMVANPEDLETYGLKRFEDQAAADSVRAALGDIPCDLLAILDGAAGPPSLEALETQLTASPQPYTLLHVVCHGKYNADDGDTLLYLANDENKAVPVSGQELRERLEPLARLPHLAFLAACETAVPEADRALCSMAQHLVRGLGLPAVVSMTRQVSLKTATDIATTFYTYLRRHGQADRALAEARAGLTARRDITAPMLYTRLGGRPLFSYDPDRPPTQAEIERGLARLDDLLDDYAPVLRDAFKQHAGNLRPLLAVREVGALAEAERATRKEALDGLRFVCSDALGITFEALAQGEDPARDRELAKTCPFLGLYAFGWEDRRFFFGRKKLVQALQARLAPGKPLAVLGPSGSGKSSVVLAGLVPAVMGQGSDKLPCGYLRPGRNPLATLRAYVAQGPLPSLLVVDQFEELFSLCDDHDERRAFVDEVLRLSQTTQLVITMRIDFLGDCMRYPALIEAIKANQEWIAPMNSAELRSAMDEQARQVLLRFEADLSNTILDAVRGEPGEMPLLQHLLKEMWNRRHGQWLRAAEYHDMGGIRGAIARTADHFYNCELTPREQELTRQIFQQLTRVGEETAADNIYVDTRRRMPLADLVGADQDAEEIRKLVDRLADARLVVTGTHATTGETEVEVVHEALIRHWPRLRDWLDEDRQLLRLHDGVKRAARDWKIYNKDSYLIHRDERLKQVTVLLTHARVKLTADETEYIEACQRLGRLAKTSIAKVGWGVLFAQDADPAIKYALRELLDHRRKEATTENPDYYHEFTGSDGYRPGETKREFLAHHDVGSSLPTPDRMPYYILIVGDPETIPFSFQYQLDMQYAVGRIHFDTLDEYAQYARSVVLAETEQPCLPQRAVVFAPQNTDDQATEASFKYLATPIANRLESIMPAWQVDRVFQKEASKARLARLLGGDDTPPLLFSCGHGMSFPIDHELQFGDQGALLCQDWPGPRGGLGPIPRDYYFSAADVSPDARLLGSIFYFWSCFGAGTPQFDNFAQMTHQGDTRRLASRSFLARLPQRLLSHPRGGALAVIGSVERKWGYTFMGELGEKDIDVFLTTLLQLMEGYTVGAAMEYFNQRYTALMSDLVMLLERSRAGEANQMELDKMWVATNDARNYIIVGDPAARLQVEPVEQADRLAIEPDLRLASPEAALFEEIGQAAAQWQEAGGATEALDHDGERLRHIESFGTLFLRTEPQRTYIRACQLRAEIERAAAAWEESGRPDEKLEHLERLGELEAVGLAFREPPAREYVAACQAVRAARQAKVEAQEREAAALRAATEQVLRAAAGQAPASDVQKQSLAAAGWGVVFAHDADPAIREALRLLVEHRRGQAGAQDERLFREFSGPDGYRPGEPAVAFLHRHGLDTGEGLAPQYLLLAGDPESIPFEFQVQLSQRYAVGRTHFETAEEYERYAHNVVQAETTAGNWRQPRAAFCAPQHPGDRATAMLQDGLLAPLLAHFGQAMPAWTVQSVLRDEATKARLSQLLGGEETPALLFWAGHGVALPANHRDQRRFQGALLCQDWPGTKAWGRKALKPDLFFSGDDVGPEADLLGLIAFFFSDFSGGTPAREEAAFVYPREPRELAARPFVAYLPRKLLGHPRGGALAVIGHVDTPWGLSFAGEWGESGLQAFQATLVQLAQGVPVGAALEPFWRRHARLEVELAQRQAEAQDEASLRDLRRAAADARNTLLLGDPAVRLPPQGAELYL
jgi:hypothetical protein